MQQNFDIRRF